MQGRRIDLENRPLTKYFMNMHFDKKNNVHRKIFHFKNWFMIMWCISLFITQVKVMMMTTNVVNVYNENPILDGSKLIHLNLYIVECNEAIFVLKLLFLRKTFYGHRMRSPILFSINIHNIIPSVLISNLLMYGTHAIYVTRCKHLNQKTPLLYFLWSLLKFDMFANTISLVITTLKKKK